MVVLEVDELSLTSHPQILARSRRAVEKIVEELAS